MDGRDSLGIERCPGHRVIYIVVQAINFTYHTDKCPFLWRGYAYKDKRSSSSFGGLARPFNDGIPVSPPVACHAGAFW